MRVKPENASLVNHKLDLPLFNELTGNLNKFTKKQITITYCMSDLINPITNEPTKRLIKLVGEILYPTNINEEK